MTTFPGKLLGLFLSFCIMVLGPAMIHGRTSELTATRTLLNETQNFIDKVIDSGEITDKELADFYLACTYYGAPMNVEVTRVTRVVNPDGKGGTYVTYVPTTNNKKFNRRDSVVVTVSALDYTPTQKLIFAVTRFHSPKYDVRLAGTVRI